MAGEREGAGVLWQGKGKEPVPWQGKVWNLHQRRETYLWYRSFSILHRSEDFLNTTKAQKVDDKIQRLTMRQLPEW